MFDIMDLCETCERRIPDTGSRCKRKVGHKGHCHPTEDLD